ncbi:hypothetical protein PMAYCL1PPCAC_01587, partial [Pristionchus mayeri]
CRLWLRHFRFSIECSRCNEIHNSTTMEGCSKPLFLTYCYGISPIPVIMNQETNNERSEWTRNEPMPFPLTDAHCQLLHQTNMLELMQQNPQGLIGTGIVHPNGLLMQENVLALNPSLIAATQQALQHEMLQRQKLIDSLLQQQQPAASAINIYGVNEGLHSQLSLIQKETLVVQQPTQQPFFTQIGMNYIHQASSLTNELALSERAQLQLKLLKGQQEQQHTAETLSWPAPRFVPPPTGASLPLVGSAAAAGESRAMSPSTGPYGRSIFVSYLPRVLSRTTTRTRLLLQFRQ